LSAKAGDLPSGLMREVDGTLNASVDWADPILKFLVDICRAAGIRSG